jgi:hypothetical protein
LEPATAEEIKKVFIAAIKEVRHLPAETVQEAEEKKEKAGGKEAPSWVKAAFKEIGDTSEKEEKYYKKIQRNRLWKRLNRLFFTLSTHVFGLCQRKI